MYTHFYWRLFSNVSSQHNISKYYARNFSTEFLCRIFIQKGTFNTNLPSEWCNRKLIITFQSTSGEETVDEMDEDFNDENEGDTGKNII